MRFKRNIILIVKNGFEPCFSLNLILEILEIEILKHTL